jgi:hypothetical protein
MSQVKEAMEALNIDRKTARELVKALKFGQLSAKGNRRLLMTPLEALINQQGERTYVTEEGLRFWKDDAKDHKMDDLIYTDDGKMFVLFGGGTLICVVRALDGLVQFFGRTNKDVDRANAATRINLVMHLFSNEPLSNPFDEFESVEVHTDILQDLAQYL